MQAGMRTFQVGDVTVVMCLNWAQHKAMKARVSRWEEGKTDADGEIERELLGENKDPETEKPLGPIVRRIEGLTDEDGQPITELTRENIGRMSPAFIQAVLKEALAPGEEVEPAPRRGRGRASA